MAARAIASEVLQCPEWTIAATGPDDGQLHLSATPDTPPAAPYPEVAVTLDGAFKANGQPGAAAVADLYAVAGDNQVWASAQTIFLGTATAPAARIAYVRDVARTAVAAVLADLSH